MTTTSTTTKTTSTATAAALAAGAKIPADRLGKVARTTHCQVFRDEQTGHDLAEAEQALAAYDVRAEATRTARLARARAAAVRDRPPYDGDVTQVTQAAEDAELAAEHAEREPLAAALEAARQRAAADVLTFTFKSLGRTRWRKAMAENPPTEEDLADWERRGESGTLQYSPEALLRYLLTHACIAPALEPGDVEAITDGVTWNEQEALLLFVTAMDAQTQAASVPSGLSVPPVVAARRATHSA